MVIDLPVFISIHGLFYPNFSHQFEWGSEQLDGWLLSRANIPQHLGKQGKGQSYSVLTCSWDVARTLIWAEKTRNTSCLHTSKIHQQERKSSNWPWEIMNSLFHIHFEKFPNEYSSYRCCFVRACSSKFPLFPCLPGWLVFYTTSSSKRYQINAEKAVSSTSWSSSYPQLPVGFQSTGGSCPMFSRPRSPDAVVSVPRFQIK